MQIFLRNVKIELEVSRLTSVDHPLVLGFLEPFDLSLLLHVNGTLSDASYMGLKLASFQFVPDVLH